MRPLPSRGEAAAGAALPRHRFQRKNPDAVHPDSFRIPLGNEYRAHAGGYFRFRHMGHEPLADTSARGLKRRAQFDRAASKMIQQRFVVRCGDENPDCAVRRNGRPFANGPVVDKLGTSGPGLQRRCLARTLFLSLRPFQNSASALRFF